MTAQLTTLTSGIAVGIDVAKAKLDVVALLPSGKRSQVVPNSPAGFVALQTWLQALGSPVEQICLEATGSYSDALSQFLWEQGYRLSVLNPAVLVSFRRSMQVRSKTDRLDAELLAHYGRLHPTRSWHPLPQAVQSLRHLLQYRLDVLAQWQAGRHRLEAGRLTPWTRAQIEAQSQQWQAHLHECEQQIRAALRTDAQLHALWQRLQTIPGIGEWAGALLIGTIGEIERFPHADALVSLAGLAVKERQSGSSVHGQACIDRHGHAELRRTLYWCAISALRSDETIAAWAQRLRARGKPNKVVLVAVMRKLLHIVYGVWKHGTAYNPALVRGPLAA
jgi:transposase